MRPANGEGVTHPRACSRWPSAIWRGAAEADAVRHSATASTRPRTLLSIVIPALNEGSVIADLLASLAPFRARGVEVVVVDGGSADGTAEAAASGADRVIVGRRGRARQMNAGAAASKAPVLLFLHADTRLPANADRLILDKLAVTGLGWGHFDVRIDGESRWLPVIGWMMNVRSRATGIPTGDQAM